jgi:hypothetical protein
VIPHQSLESHIRPRAHRLGLKVPHNFFTFQGQLQRFTDTMFEISSMLYRTLNIPRACSQVLKGLSHEIEMKQKWYKVTEPY